MTRLTRRLPSARTATAGLFLAAAGLQVAGLYLDRQLVPYAGTLAMTALLSFALASPPSQHRPVLARRLGLGGLALLAITAGLVDARTGGYGWPAEIGTGRNGSAPIELNILTMSMAALVAAVIGCAGRLRRRYRVFLVLFGVLMSIHVGQYTVQTWHPLRSPAKHVVLTPLQQCYADVMRGMLLYRTAVRAPTESRGTYSPSPPSPQSCEVAPPPAWAVHPAPLPAEPVDIPAVSGPPSWSLNVWEGEPDWTRAMPALLAALLLCVLSKLVTLLFPAPAPFPRLPRR